MIRNFRHRGLKRLYEHDDPKRLPAEDVDRIKRILAQLDDAPTAQHMDLPGLHLHLLKGEYKGFWSVSVRGNWRIIFRFEKETAFDVGYIDYH